MMPSHTFLTPELLRHCLANPIATFQINEARRSAFTQVAGRILRNEHVPAPDRWGEVFGDDVVAAAMIDRLVHHAEVVALKGDSYRLKDRDLGRVPGSSTEET